MVYIFCDLEKADDTTWNYGIMKDVHDMDLRGCLPLSIKTFLFDIKEISSQSSDIILLFLCLRIGRYPAWVQFYMSPCL